MDQEELWKGDNKMDEYLLEKMEDQREEALTALSKIFPNYCDELSDALAYSYVNGLASAERIANSLNLCPLDFYAILGDYKDYRDEFVRDLDNTLQQEAYERTIRYA
jgi:hypothetical protein